MDNNILQVVNFVINGQMYGINIQEIQNIERMKQITKVPQTSNAVKGILNLRGEIIPVISVREQLNFADLKETEDSRIVIIQVDDDKTGVIVDQVKEVLEIEVDKIEQVPNVSNADNMINTNHISGIAKINGGEYIVSILNIKNVINDAFNSYGELKGV